MHSPSFPALDLRSPKDLLYLVVRGWPRRILWLARWRLRNIAPKKLRTHEGARLSLDDCSIVYINLDSRTDRKALIESEFGKLNIGSAVRFSAVAKPFGGLGCSLSHAECLSAESLGDKKLLMICEDDVEFVANRTQLEEVVSEFYENELLDVLCLGNVSIERPYCLDGALSISNSIQTTSCYIAKPRAIPLLQDSAQNSAKHLERSSNYARHALDQEWKKLQQGELFFSVPTSQLAKQRASYSDIEAGYVDYQN